MTLTYSPPTLTGRKVRLEPLSEDHVSDLVRAANEERSTYLFTEVPSTSDETRAYVKDLLEAWRADQVVPFAQVDLARGLVVGVTRYMTIRSLDGVASPFSVEIGGTWLAASAQRTSINTEAKILLLEYAFTTWGCARVELKTDERNERSRAAILRLGASFEGVLRHYQPSLVAGEESRYRNTAIYSITDAEWPSVRDALTLMVR